MVAVFSEIFNMSQWTTWFENSYFMIDKYPKCYNKYIIQNKNEYYDE